MSSGKIVITLEREDLLELQEILVEEDPEAALRFLKETIIPKAGLRKDFPGAPSGPVPFIPGPSPNGE